MLSISHARFLGILAATSLLACGAQPEFPLTLDTKALKRGEETSIVATVGTAAFKAPYPSTGANDWLHLVVGGPPGTNGRAWDAVSGAGEADNEAGITIRDVVVKDASTVSLKMTLDEALPAGNYAFTVAWGRASAGEGGRGNTTIKVE